MFSSAIQPGLVSLLSSTGSDPLGIFSSHTDSSLPSDSLIVLLNDATSSPRPPAPAALVSPSRAIPSSEEEAHLPDYALQQTVLHIQSPTLQSTYVRCPPLSAAVVNGRNGDLGMKHPWIHFQVRNMGREWSFEVGLVDQSGREGTVRCSTFQKQPRLNLGSHKPLLHLPLAFPLATSHPLTSWSTIALHLPSLLPYFSTASLVHGQGNNDSDGEDFSDDDNIPRTARPHQSFAAVSHVSIPSGTYSHVSYVKVYATCRLRRIWFSEGGPGQRLPWEYQLYAAD